MSVSYLYVVADFEKWCMYLWVVCTDLHENGCQLLKHKISDCCMAIEGVTHHLNCCPKTYSQFWFNLEVTFSHKIANYNHLWQRRREEANETEKQTELHRSDMKTDNSAKKRMEMLQHSKGQKKVPWIGNQDSKLKK